MARSRAAKPASSCWFVPSMLGRIVESKLRHHLSDGRTVSSTFDCGFASISSRHITQAGKSTVAR